MGELLGDPSITTAILRGLIIFFSLSFNFFTTLSNLFNDLRVGSKPKHVVQLIGQLRSCVGGNIAFSGVFQHVHGPQGLMENLAKK